MFVDVAMMLYDLWSVWNLLKSLKSMGLAARINDGFMLELIDQYVVESVKWN